MGLLAAAAGLLTPDTRTWIEQRSAGDPYISGRVGLARVPAIVPGGGSDQPVSLGHRAWGLVDGRIDDRARLRGGLAAGGRAVPEGCDDDELVLHAYETWGADCLDRLIGDFAFVIWDERLGRLFAAHDQLGVGQLHYARAGGELLIASAIDDLLSHPAVDDRLDEEWIADFLGAGFPLDRGATTFQLVRRLPPAHCLLWGPGRLDVQRYWRPPTDPPLIRLKRTEDYVRRFEELLEAAVADRLGKDRAALHLSGGMDSTSVAATAARLRSGSGASGDSLQAFLAIGARDQERPYAEAVAAGLGLPFEVISAADLPDLDPFAPPLPPTPEPMAYPWNRVGHEIAVRAAAHAPVVLTGFAGDALLLYDERWWIRWLLDGQLMRVMRAVCEARRVTGTVPRIRPRQLVSYAMMRGGMRGYRAPPIPSWVRADLVRRSGVLTRLQGVVPRCPRDPTALAVEPIWASSFATADPSFSGVPARFAHPLIDLRLLGFVLRLPPDPWLVDKRIAREAMRGRLPEVVRNRPKTPLGPGPRPGASGDPMARVIAMVRARPGADRYIDRESLIAGLERLSRGENLRARYSLGTAVGLIQWMAHRGIDL